MMDSRARPTQSTQCAPAHIAHNAERLHVFSFPENFILLIPEKPTHCRQHRTRIPTSTCRVFECSPGGHNVQMLYCQVVDPASPNQELKEIRPGERMQASGAV